jgi:hypothetical protein
MPTPDIPWRKRNRIVHRVTLTRGRVAVSVSQFPRQKKGRRGLGPEAGGVPVEPNRPNTLTGGAAVALDFEED